MHNYTFIIHVEFKNSDTIQNNLGKSCRRDWFKVLADQKERIQELDLGKLQYYLYK